MLTNQQPPKSSAKRRKTPSRRESIGTRLTSEERAALTARLTDQRTSESDYVRSIILQSLDASPDTKTLLEFICISEEKMRQHLILAATGKLGDKEALEAAETKAIELGLGRYQRRLRLIRQAQGKGAIER